MISALVALVTTAVLTPVVIAGGRRLNVLDSPGGHKRHAVAVPGAGGIAVLAGLAVASCVAFIAGTREAGYATLPLIVAVAVIFAIGLLDDIRGCSVGFKIAAQAVAGLLVVVFGPKIDIVGEPTGLAHIGTAVGSLVALLWLMGITNAFNFFDGLDGLAIGGGAMISATLAVISALNGDHLAIIIALATCGSCVGFLPYNWQPARIFLGDSGSLTIGFVLGWLTLVNSLQADTAVALIVPPLLLAVPAIDALLVICHRFTEGTAVGLLTRAYRTTQADRQHLHHRLLALVSGRTAVLVIYAIVATNCVLALLALSTGSLLLVATTLLFGIVVVASSRAIAYSKLRNSHPLATPNTRSPLSQDPISPEIVGVKRLVK